MIDFEKKCYRFQCSLLEGNPRTNCQARNSYFGRLPVYWTHLQGSSASPRIVLACRGFPIPEEKTHMPFTLMIFVKFTLDALIMEPDLP